MSLHFPDIDLVIFDKDGVLVDLATWVPLVVGLVELLEARARALGDNETTRETLLAAVGITAGGGSDDNSGGGDDRAGGGAQASDGNSGGDAPAGHVREDGLFASGVFGAVREAWAEAAPVLAPLLGNWDAFRPDMERIIDERIRGKTIAFGDVAEELAALKASGRGREQALRLAIATNDTERSARMNFDDLGIADFFDAVLAADSGHGKKPEPDMVLEICRRVAVPPGRAVMIGDTIADWGAARGAGLAGFIAIAPTAPALPDYLPDADLVMRNIEGLAGRFGYSGK